MTMTFISNFPVIVERFAPRRVKWSSDDDRSADAQSRVHDLVFKARLEHSRRRGIRAVLVVHEHLHLRAESLAVELYRLFTATTEEQVGLDRCVVHVRSLCSC